MNDNAQMVVALYDYAARAQGELSIRKNEKLLVLDDRDQWWKVQNDRAQEGLVPSTYVERKNSLKSKKKLMEKIYVSSSKKTQKETSERLYALPQEARPTEANSVESSAFVKYNYQPVVEDELALTKGEKVIITRKNSDGWWYGTCHGRSGWLPSNYVIEETTEPFQGKPSGKLSTSSASVICKVKTMYPFTSANEEELNFDEDQILDIIDQPADDPDWWKARTCDGHEGLVPITFVQIIPESVAKIESSVNTNSPRPAMKTHTNEPWFFGTMTREKAEESMMKNARDGDYLVRCSERQPGDFAVSVKTPENIKHFRVQCREGKFRIGQRIFDSMQELIEHYKKAPIVTIRNGQKMYLVEPYANNPNGYYPRK